MVTNAGMESPADEPTTSYLWIKGTVVDTTTTKPCRLIMVDANRAASLLAGKQVNFIDIRPAESWSKSHINNTVNVPYLPDNPALFRHSIADFDKERTCVIVGATPVNTTLAGRELQKAGFLLVYQLAEDWKELQTKLNN